MSTDGKYREGDDPELPSQNEEEESKEGTPETPESEETADSKGKGGQMSSVVSGILVLEMEDGCIEVAAKIPGIEFKKVPDLHRVKDMLRSAYDDIMITLSGRSAAMAFLNTTAQAQENLAKKRQSEKQIIIPKRFSGRGKR